MSSPRFQPGNDAASKSPEAHLLPFCCRLDAQTLAKVHAFGKRRDLGLKSQGAAIKRAMACLEVHALAGPLEIKAED